MAAREQLLQLQWAQLKHDEAYHKDVVILPLAERIKHMALHNAKYTAYFFDAADRRDNARFEAILTDAFIINLASANTLNQDLGHELTEALSSPSLHELGSSLSVSLSHDPADPLWLVRQFARINGRLAKLCESWDHLESADFREGMKRCNLALFKAVLAESSARNLELSASYNVRIEVVETRSIFHRQFREVSGGEA